MTAMALQPTDRAIVRTTHAGLPLCREPYRAVAEQLRLQPEEVMRRLRWMLEAGVIRRIGAVPDHCALGYRADGMSVWDVDDARVSELGRMVKALPSVSHCCRRPRQLPGWPYNLFAMVHGRSREAVMDEVAKIAAVLGPASHGHDVLHSMGTLKKASLQLGE
jgi:DNA-binding Lrp family transcriptional regulator